MFRYFIVLVSLLSVTAGYAQDVPFDCVNARKLYNKSSVTVAGSEFGSVGAFDEKGSCFTSNERAPYWFTFEVCKSGSLIAYIDPSGDADFDYVLYDVTAGCGAKTQLLCNSEAASGNNNTGVGCTDNSCDPEYNVEEGKTYAILFSRYTLTSNDGFTLQLGGSCEFTDPSLVDHQPDVVGENFICGMTGLLSAIVNPNSTFQWTGQGPGTVTFTNPNDATSGVTVTQAGTYRFFLTATKTICEKPVDLVDSIDIEFKAITSLFGDASYSYCAATTEPIDLKSLLSGTPPDNGRWTDDSNSGRLDSNGFFNPYGLGGNTFNFTYTVPVNALCFDTTGVVSVTVSKELQVLTDSVRCFNGGSNYRVFTHILGGSSASYQVNGVNQPSAYFSSGFLANTFQYTFVISDGSGCDPVTISGTKDCSCSTEAGNLDATTTLDCSSQTISFTHQGNEFLDGNDVKQYILYSDPANAKGSILLRSNTPSFRFQSPLNADTYYYIAAIAGSNDGNGDADLNDLCLSISGALRVKFPGTSSVTLTGDTLICEGGKAELTFTSISGSKVAATYQVNGEYYHRYLNPGVTKVLVDPKVNTSYTLDITTDVYGCIVNSSGSATVTVNQIPTFSYSLITDSVVCVGQPVGKPTLLFNVGSGDNLTVTYSVNGVAQAPISNVSSGTLFVLDKVVTGRNTFRVEKLESTVTGCIFNVIYPEVNYYYLDVPAISISSDVLELCDQAGAANVTFTYTGNIKLRLYYNINNVKRQEDIDATTTLNIPVVQPITITLDSVFYPEFNACTFPVSGSVVIKQYNKPTLSLKTEPITCTDTKGRLEINSSDRTALYNVDGLGFSSDTIYETSTSGTRQLSIKLGDNCIWTEEFTINYIPPFTLSVVETDTKCNKENGGFVPTPSGSFQIPISYSFNGQSNNTNLPAGPYVITATDALGCTVTVLDTIEASQPFIFSAHSQDTTKCVAGTKGSIVVSAAGGDGTIFTYSTDNINYNGLDTIKNLDPRYYTVYAKNEKGCIDSMRIQVKADTILAINLEVNNYLKCYESTDAEIKILVPNSTATLLYSTDGYSYVSNPIVSNLGPGQKIFYARETSGCKREARVDFTVTRPNPLHLTLISQGNPACFNTNNGFMVLKAQGSANVNYLYTVNAGANYQSAGAFSGLPGGEYTMFALNVDGCSTDTLRTTLVAPDSIRIHAIDLILGGADATGTITVHASGEMTPLQYSIDGTNYFSDSTFTNVPRGTYTIYVKDAKGCIATDSILVGFTGIGELALDASSVYPNPFINKLSVDAGAELIKNVMITNSIGQHISNKTDINKNTVELETENWPAGVYYLTITTSNYSNTIKVIKR